jgi:hypothetical protein
MRAGDLSDHASPRSVDRQLVREDERMSKRHRNLQNVILRDACDQVFPVKERDGSQRVVAAASPRLLSRRQFNDGTTKMNSQYMEG